MASAVVWRQLILKDQELEQRPKIMDNLKEKIGKLLKIQISNSTYPCMLFNHIHPIDFDVFTLGMQSNAKHTGLSSHWLLPLTSLGFREGYILIALSCN